MDFAMRERTGPLELNCSILLPGVLENLFSLEVTV